jgi:hypothetical protein
VTTPLPNVLSTPTTVAVMIPSPPQSSPKISMIERLLLKLKPILELGEHELCEVDGVTPALFAELEAHLIQTGQVEVWKNLR